MTSMLTSQVFIVVFTFLPVFGLYCLNFIAGELENPFGTDDNDLPLEHFQTEMNNCLMMLLHPNTDLIANVGPRCETDFFKLRLAHRMSNKDGENAHSHHVGNFRSKTKRLSEWGSDQTAEDENAEVRSWGTASH